MNLSIVQPPTMGQREKIQRTSDRVAQAALLEWLNGEYAKVTADLGSAVTPELVYRLQGARHALEAIRAALTEAPPLSHQPPRMAPAGETLGMRDMEG